MSEWSEFDISCMRLALELVALTISKGQATAIVIRQAQRLRPLFHEQRLRRRKDIGARFLRRTTDSG